MNAYESKKRFGLSRRQSLGSWLRSRFRLNDDRWTVVKIVGARLARARAASRLEIGAMAQPASRFQTVCRRSVSRHESGGIFLPAIATLRVV